MTQLNKQRLLITGATGFIGNRLRRQTVQEGWPVRLALRQYISTLDGVVVGDIGADTDWSVALKDIDVVVHMAARVHVMNDSATDPLAEFRHTNVMGTLNLAQQAVSHGVKRFIFISSIKVNGESTPLNHPYTADDTPAPVDPYGISKYEAEEGLRSLARESGLEVVIIRPPIVYGPEVKANFLRLMRWLHRGIPLPLGAIQNKRSLVALDNLVDLIVTCIRHPAAANQIFLAGDGDDLSTTDLLMRLSKMLRITPRLIPVPQKLLGLALNALGKSHLAERLCGSLMVDIRKTIEMLDWHPIVTVDEGLRHTAEWYLKIVEENCN